MLFINQFILMKFFAKYIFKIDYQIKTLKRARISFDIVNHNFLIKLSENQILNAPSFHFFSKSLIW